MEARVPDSAGQLQCRAGRRFAHRRVSDVDKPRPALIRAKASQTAMYRQAASKITTLEPRIRTTTAEVRAGDQIRNKPDATETTNAMGNAMEASLSGM